MTVDAIETPIAARTYKGNVVLTVTRDIPVSVTGMATKTYHFRTAIDIENGKYVPEKSVAAAVAAGTVTDASAKDVKITSVGENFNGIIVTGDTKSSYSIINPVIKLTGNGTNDFAGFGAAIMTEGKAEVTIENAKINNTGAVRTAIWVGGDSITKINNSDIEVHNGTLPKDLRLVLDKGRRRRQRRRHDGSALDAGPYRQLPRNQCSRQRDCHYYNTHVKGTGMGGPFNRRLQEYETLCDQVSPRNC